MRAGRRLSSGGCLGLFLLLVIFLEPSRAVAAAPSREQLEAARALSSTGDWYVGWDDETGSPATIEHRVSTGAAYRRPRPFKPEALAESFLQRHAGLFPLRPGLDSLVVVDRELPPRISRRPRAVRVRMAQRYMGLPVEWGHYGFSMAPDGKVAFVNGRFHPGIELDPRPTIDGEEAVRIAMREVGAGADSVERPIRLIVSTQDHQYRLAWSVAVPEDWAHIWVVQVDAHDGSVVSRHNRVIIDPR